MMMRNLGVNTGPLKGGGPHQRLGGGPVHRSNNCLSSSPRPPRSPATTKPAGAAIDSLQPSVASSRENVNRLNEEREAPRTKGSSSNQGKLLGPRKTPRTKENSSDQGKLLGPKETPRTKGSPEVRPLVDGVRQEVNVDVEPTPVDIRLPPSTVSDSIILIVPDLVTATTARVVPGPVPRSSSLAGASDDPHETYWNSWGNWTGFVGPHPTGK